MCLQCRPTTVSCVCIKLACERSNWDLPQLIDGREWFWFVDKGLTREILEELAAEFSTVLEKCPSRVKRKMQSLSSVKKEVHSAEKHPKVECIKTGTPVRMIEKPSQDCKKDSALCNSASVSRPQAIIKPSTNGQSLTDHRTHINVNLVTNVTMPTENLMMKSDGQQEPSIAFCSVSQSLSENRQLANNYPSHIKCHSSILSNEEHRLVHNHPNSFLRSSSGNDALFQDFSSNDSSSKDFIQKLPTIQMVGTSVAESNVQRELSTTFVQSVSHSTSSSLPPIMKLEGSEVVGSVSTLSEPKYHSNGTSVCSQVNKDLNIMYKNDNSLDSKSQSSQETTHEKFKSSKRRSPRIEKMSNSFRSGTLTNSVKDGVKITAGTLTNSVKDGVKITSGTLTNSIKDGVKITSGTLLERTSKRKHHEKHKHKRSGKEKSTDYISSPSQPVSLKITINRVLSLPRESTLRVLILYVCQYWVYDSQISALSES
ncbi:cyclin-T2-like [Limulus polyphemus]|uniref:Cyclin-T2-like n=1 Tax=Limulus polyphemus TaxID=6850 RepID=A0ABM1C1S8_LIMPO|nr:cyclin-T2-like [Limulus polyphemus]